MQLIRDMKYFILKNNSNSFVYGDVSFSPDLGFVYSNRELLDRLPEKTVIDLKMTSSVRKLKADFFPINIGYAVSERIAEILENGANKDVRLHECVTTLNNGNAVEGKFYFVEIISWVDCFNFEKSIYDKNNLMDLGAGQIVRSCERFEVIEEALSGISMAFVKHVAFSDPIISDPLWQILNKVQLCETSVIPTEKFQWDI